MNTGNVTPDQNLYANERCTHPERTHLNMFEKENIIRVQIIPGYPQLLPLPPLHPPQYIYFNILINFGISL